ncbi:MAG: hypothetical protein KDD22_02145 [Bdellovibrionales bacterium]|nr:hypothetical protein [Bdellovibrionales bacterium]
MRAKIVVKNASAIAQEQTTFLEHQKLETNEVLIAANISLLNERFGCEISNSSFTCPTDFPALQKEELKNAIASFDALLNDALGMEITQEKSAIYRGYQKSCEQTKTALSASELQN